MSDYDKKMREDKAWLWAEVQDLREAVKAKDAEIERLNEENERLSKHMEDLRRLHAERINKRDEALRVALEALERIENDITYHGVVNGDALDAAITKIKEAL